MHADHGAVITHPEKDLAADGVGQSHQFPSERRREILLELEGRPFPLLDEDVEIIGCHAKTSDLLMTPSLTQSVRRSHSLQIAASGGVVTSNLSA